MLKGKNILIGVTGSIAAYKAALLVRLLVKQGAVVKVVMTDAAKEFITPLTLSTLSKNPVLSDFYNNKTEGSWNNHVELGLWAHMMIVAPATAKTISGMASGFCDNLLQAVYLSARCPVMIAPAMDLDMFQHFSTKENLTTLQNNKVIVIEPNDGELASGLVGQGRMAEPEGITQAVVDYFGANKPLKGKKVLITAGPTYEAIDPVRFIGNHSSGKMGIALAEEAYNLGAEVVLVCGPSSVASNDGIKRINVRSAEEMFNAAKQHYDVCDVAIMSAAVADFTPANKTDKKIKKSDANLAITLKPTVDILKTFGQQKKHQILVGFALETDNELENAKGKLKNKNADFIVLNSLQNKGAGFGHDTNQIQIIDKNNKITASGLVTKQAAAKQILEVILNTTHD